MPDDLSYRKDDYYPSRVFSHPEFVQREDPVIYTDWTPDAPLTKAQYDSYKRDGFLFLEGFLDEDEVAALLRESDRLRSPEADLDRETVFREMEAGAVRSVFAVHEQSDLLHRLGTDARLAGIARFILDDDIYIHQSRLNYKPGFEGEGFYWHSDFETWHVEDGMPRMRALSMSVLLTDNHIYNGPLMLIPGSHKYYVSCIGETPEDHYKSSLRRQEFGVPDHASLGEMYRRGGIAVPRGPAGSIIFFDCNTMHGSASNISPLPRSNAFFVYNAVSNQVQEPFGAAKPRPEFVSARDHVEPIELSERPIAANG